MKSSTFVLMCHMLSKPGSPVLVGLKTPVCISVMLVGWPAISVPSREPRGLLDRAHPEYRKTWPG